MVQLHFMDEPMTADEFKAFLVFCRTNYNVSDSRLAKILGCHRISITRWQKSGAPRYIGLACAAAVNGLSPWKPDSHSNPQHNTGS